MNPLTCAEVAPQLDLYAAEACAPRTAQAIETHLARCDSCRLELQEARQLQAGLDWHHRETAALARLEVRLHQQARPAREGFRSILSFFPRPPLRVARQLAGVAAAFLLTVGLAAMLDLHTPAPSPQPLNVAWLAPQSRADLPAPVRASPQQEKMVLSAPSTRLDYTLAPDAATRSQLLAPGAILPAPPRVQLAVGLRNETPWTLLLHPEQPGTELHLDLRGPDVLRFTLPPGSATPSLQPTAVELRPGMSTVLRIGALVEGTRATAAGWYWTEPGTYSLRVRYRVAVSAPPDTRLRWHTFTTSPILLQVHRP